tara:strand:+ start:1539 stop:1730 length:192 start_codon:yes stop_codon:yes gene_type:complete
MGSPFVHFGLYDLKLKKLRLNFNGCYPCCLKILPEDKSNGGPSDLPPGANAFLKRLGALLSAG